MEKIEKDLKNVLYLRGKQNLGRRNDDHVEELIRKIVRQKKEERMQTAKEQEEL